METQTKTRNVKDFFINLGAFIGLYTLVFSVLNLLFTVINAAYPQINSYSYYGGSNSISWPVSTIIIFFPIFIFLMWIMEREYILEPERQNQGIHKWLTYITLFVAGLVIAGDLVTVLYYFLDGQELTTAFLLKVLAVLVVLASVFTYYISDVSGKLTSRARKVWRVIALVIVAGSVVLGFVVLGSPRTQQLLKYDEQKINDLANINGQIDSYFYNNKKLPNKLEDISQGGYYVPVLDPQSKKPYEYKKTSENTYELCAEFNKVQETPQARGYIYGGNTSWAHKEGYSCFSFNVNLGNSSSGLYPKPILID